jgi:hypothetical protein
LLLIGGMSFGTLESFFAVIVIMKLLVRNLSNYQHNFHSFFVGAAA